jgi:hypothetical protein
LILELATAAVIVLSFGIYLGRSWLGPRPGVPPTGAGQHAVEPVATVYDAKVEKVYDDGRVWVTPLGTGQNTSFATDAETVVMIDGRRAKLAELKRQMTVRITVNDATGLATEIVATSGK